MANKTGFLTIKAALQQGTKILEESSVAAPRLTAEVLLSHAVNKERIHLYSHFDDELSESSWIHFGRYLHQRSGGLPTQYITRRQEFYGREFLVSRDVLIPRPETELVAQAAIDRLHEGDTVVDIGCGSGALAITIALEKRVIMFASDISFKALSIARENAIRLNALVAFLGGDLLCPFAPGSLNMVVSNPPYVGWNERDGIQREVLEHEPHVALFGGETGNEIYAPLIRQASAALHPGGWLVLELGWRSLDAVRAMLDASWTEVEEHGDFSGIPRAITARRAK
ncbi:MAG: peptide chain release factor N(5)-glutamine methyltransferase [Bryobacteraceae bacterium]